MKLLIIIFHDIESLSSGIGKKILAQYNAFINLNIDTSITYLATDKNNHFDRRMVNNTLLEKYKTKFGIHKRWQWRFRYKKLIEYIENNDINTVYLRYTHFANPFFINFLRKLKILGVFIIMEIPTYPYDHEYHNIKPILKFALLIEHCCRQYFKNYVNLIVTFSNEKEIFGVRTIIIDNGIELNSTPMKKQYKKSNNDLHLIAVASMRFWHGYDRIIKGLKNYYHTNPKIKVFLHLVGNTEKIESKKYIKLVNEYQLNEYVIFHGFKKGKELDELFDYSDIAIGCLGNHRKGITKIKSLKNREYCARGIPFTYSESDDSFDDQPFILKLPADENPVNIFEIIKFYNSIDLDSKEIRKFAEEKLTWEKQLIKIIEKINTTN